MNHLTVRCRKMGCFTNGQQKTARWMLVWLLLVVTACQSNATALTPENVAETQPPTATPEPTATTLPTPTAAPTAITGENLTNIPYLDTDHPLNKLDIYLPDEQAVGPFPTLLFIPTGWKQNLASDMANYFTHRGYATIIVDLSPLAAEPFPAQLEASFCALGWLHANAATYGLDPAHIFAVGSMEMASWAALPGLMPTADAAAYLTNCPHVLPETNRVRGIIMMCGYFDYTIPELQEQFEREAPDFFGRYAENTEPWENASPITWADESDPPLLYVCGDDLTDPLTPVWADILRVVHDRVGPQIQQTGIDGTVVFVHEPFLDSFFRQTTFAVMEEFMARNLD